MRRRSAAYPKKRKCKDQMEDDQGPIEYPSKAIKLKPKDPTVYFNKGVEKEQKQQYKEAIKDYSKAIELKPNYAEAYCNRGNCKSEMKQYKEAIKDYSKAIKLKPNYAEAYCNRGNCKSEMKQYKEAIQDYSKAIELQPDDAEAYYNRGICKSEMKQYKEAIEDYSKAIELQPDDAEAYYNRGALKDQLKQYKEAIKDYNKAIKLNKQLAEAYCNRGKSKSELKQYQRAIEDCSKAISLKQDYIDAYNNRGYTRHKLKKYEEAELDYLKALLLMRPQPSPLLLFNLANLYIDMDKEEQAWKRYKEGVKCFQQENVENLKEKFGLSDEHISYFQSSIQKFEEIQNQVEEIRKQAQKKNRTDILQQLVQFDEAIFSACVKATEEKADQKQTNSTWLLYESQLKEIKKRLEMVQRKVSKLEAKVEQMEKRIYTEERINNMIENINNQQLSEFFKILYNMLINHFMAYRMLSTGFFSESVRDVTTFDNVVGKICKAQPIIQSIPILGDLVGIPFQILSAFREEKSSHLNSVIANKINGSILQSEAILTSYIAHSIEILIKNKPFNARLMKAIQQKQKGFLNMVMEVFGERKEKLYSKFFGGSTRKVSYAQEAVLLHVARFTLHLFNVDSDKFAQHCESEETFGIFFTECFEEKTKSQPIIRNENSGQVINKNLEQANNSTGRAMMPEGREEQQSIQQRSRWKCFFGLICCCCQTNSRRRSDGPTQQ